MRTGHYSNYVGTHFWHTASPTGTDLDGAGDEGLGEIDASCTHRVSVDGGSGRAQWQPRLVAFDLMGSLGCTDSRKADAAAAESAPFWDGAQAAALLGCSLQLAPKRSHGAQQPHGFRRSHGAD